MPARKPTTAPNSAGSAIRPSGLCSPQSPPTPSLRRRRRRPAGPPPVRSGAYGSCAELQDVHGDAVPADLGRRATGRTGRSRHGSHPTARAWTPGRSRSRRRRRGSGPSPRPPAGARERGEGQPDGRGQDRAERSLVVRHGEVGRRRPDRRAAAAHQHDVQRAEFGHDLRNPSACLRPVGDVHTRGVDPAARLPVDASLSLGQPVTVTGADATCAPSGQLPGGRRDQGRSTRPRQARPCCQVPDPLCPPALDPPTFSRR